MSKFLHEPQILDEIIKKKIGKYISNVEYLKLGRDISASADVCGQAQCLQTCRDKIFSFFIRFVK